MIRAIPPETGFTLLELLLVVTILSSLALATVSFVENEDNQLRFEDTRARLERIRSAVLGPEYPDGRTLSGYAVDNGKLPESIKDLLERPTNLVDFGPQNPIFDPQPDSDGINNGGGTALTEAEEILLKGYRAGSYVRAPAGTELAFYDGWGNNPSYTTNYGWSVSGPPTTFTVTSLGSDGSVGGTTDYETDISVTVGSDDWQHDIAGWQVTVTNRSGTDLAIASPACLRVSLLVFENNSTTNNWKRWTSDCVPGNTATAANGSCLAGDDGDDEVAGVACDASVDISFPATGSANFPPSTKIPAGEHLVVLAIDDDATPHNGSTGETLCLGGGNCSSGSRHSARVRFIGRASRPTADIIVR